MLLPILARLSLNCTLGRAVGQPVIGIPIIRRFFAHFLASILADNDIPISGVLDPALAASRITEYVVIPHIYVGELSIRRRGVAPKATR